MTDTAAPLTAEQIRSEPAGGRLNGWVAERVLGWTALHTEFIRGVLGCPGDTFLFGTDPAGRKEIVPSYSTDIAAAWTIAETLHVGVTPTRDGWVAMVRRRPDGIWLSPWFWTNNHFVCPVGEGETAALAIARCALLTTLETK